MYIYYVYACIYIYILCIIYIIYTFTYNTILCIIYYVLCILCM